MRHLIGWDKLIRIVHWLVAVLFILNVFVVEADSYVDDYFIEWASYDSFAEHSLYLFFADRSWHECIGWAILGLLIIRLIWGLTLARGPNHLYDFIPRRKDAMHHIMLLKKRQPHHEVGHNAFGALAVYAMWGGLIALVLSGYYQDSDWGFDNDLDIWHKRIADFMQIMVLLHLSAIVFTSLRLRQNLIRAMIHGHFRPKSQLAEERRAILAEEEALHEHQREGDAL